MSQLQDGLRGSLLVGCLAAVAFFVGFISLLYSHPDAQNGIGVVLSPFLAGWFGTSVGFLWRGWQILRHVEAAQKLNSQVNETNVLMGYGAIYLWFGIVGVSVIVLWLWSEEYQATHPNHVGGKLGSERTLIAS